MFDRLVADEPFHRMDVHRRIDDSAVARRFAWMIAGAPHDRRQRIVLRDLLKGGVVGAFLGMSEPFLDVLASRAE